MDTDPTQPQTTLDDAGDEVTVRRDADDPGDAKGVPVPHDEPSPASSEQFKAVDGVYTYPETSEEPDQGPLGRIE
jgi:hypothetical protein